MKKILVVEDSKEAFALIRASLEPVGQLDWAKSCSEAMTILNHSTVDLIVLDGTLPDGDGLQLCSMLQSQDEWAAVPIIILTARSSTADKVMAFSVGAEDFISKPFEPLELRARVESKLRKVERVAHTSDLLYCGDIEINKSTQRATISENGTLRGLNLSPTEFKLLLVFAASPGVVLSRDHILDVVWGEQVYTDARAVDTHVSKLRKKLGTASEWLSSVHGAGYKMVPPSKSIPSTSESELASGTKRLPGGN